MGKNSIVAAVMDRLAAQNGVDRAAVAVAFLLAHPAGILPVLGTNTLSRISTISDALRVRLDRQDWFKLYEVARSGSGIDGRCGAWQLNSNHMKAIRASCATRSAGLYLASPWSRQVLIRVLLASRQIAFLHCH